MWGPAKQQWTTLGGTGTQVEQQEERAATPTALGGAGGQPQGLGVGWQEVVGVRGAPTQQQQEEHGQQQQQQEQQQQQQEQEGAPLADQVGGGGVCPA